MAIFVEKNKFSIERPDLSISNTTCEIIAIEVISKVSKNILIINIYKIPSSNHTDFLDILESLFDKIMLEKKLIYCVGDFNININNHNSNADNLLNTMASFFLYPINQTPTRTTSHTSSNIDLIFTNNISSFNGGVIQTDISDHYPIFISQLVSKIQTKPNNQDYV